MRHSLPSRPPRLRNPQIDLRPLEEVSQEDISNAVRAFRPVEGHVHQARIRKAKEILRRRGYTLTGSALGAGTMATTFALEDYPDYIAKLTYDPTDAALMAEMAQIERKAAAAGKPMPAGLPVVVTVAQLGRADDPLGLYFIVVERLVPLNAEQKKRVSSLARKLSWGSLADTSVGDALWDNWKIQKKSPEHALLNAARTINSLGYIPYDLDASNTMQRPSDGSVVVSDFGYSSPRRGTPTRAIPRLENPAGSVYDAYDFVVKPSESSQQFWEPTGEGAGVRPVRYAYTRLQVRVSERSTGRAVGGVGGASEERAGTRVRLKDGSCERDFAALAARHPGLRGVIVVTGASLEEDVRGKGVGLAMYRLFAQEAGKQGFAIVPEECWSGTTLTSADAKRVWAKLAREPGMDAEGRVVYAPPPKGNPRRRNPDVIVRDGVVHGVAAKVWEQERTAGRTRKDWPEWAREVLLDPVWDAEDVIEYDRETDVAHVVSQADLSEVLRWAGMKAPRRRGGS
jgi:hypothetical protein